MSGRSISYRNIGYAGKFLGGEKPNIWHKLAAWMRNRARIMPSAVISRNVQFADVSFYQKTISWETYKAHAPAVIIRVGQNSWPDSQFPRNWAEAKRMGIKRGAYWFYDDRASPLAQAKLCAQTIGVDKPEMEIFVDYETVYGGPYQGLANVVAMMKEIERLMPGVRVGIYTGYYFFNSHADSRYFDYLSTHPLWLAWWTTNPEYVKIPAAWSKLTHWQWGTPTVGTAWGVGTAELDMNWFNGTQAEFNQKYGGAIVDPTPPPGEQNMTTYTNGVKITNTLKYGFDTRIIEIPHSAVRSATFWTWGDCRYVEQVDGDVVFNFTDYSPATCAPVYGLRMNYKTIKEWLTNAAPFLGWDDTNMPIINHPKTVFNSLRTASQGYRYIVLNGVKNPAWINSDAWDQREPRRLVGTRADGTLVIISVCKQNIPGVGITLHEACDIGLELGLNMMIDGDSGSSLQDVVRLADGTALPFVVDQRGAPAVWGIVKFHSGLVPVTVDPEPPPPSPTGVPFVLDVDGYKPYSGVLEPDE